MADVETECEVERLHIAKEEVKKAKLAVHRRSLYERLKKSVNVNSTATETELSNCVLQTLSFEQLRQKLLEERLTNVSEMSRQTYHRHTTGNILFLLKNKDKKYYTKLGAELGKKYSKRYCYSMIEFYQFCDKYPRMKYVGIGFSQYKDKMTGITKLFENDSDFWRLS